MNIADFYRLAQLEVFISRTRETLESFMYPEGEDTARLPQATNNTRLEQLLHQLEEVEDMVTTHLQEAEELIHGKEKVSG